MQVVSYPKILVVICSILCLENSSGRRRLFIVIVLELSVCGYFIFRNGGIRKSTQRQVQRSIICFYNFEELNRILSFLSLNLFLTCLELFYRR